MQFLCLTPAVSRAGRDAATDRGPRGSAARVGVPFIVRPFVAQPDEQMGAVPTLLTVILLAPGSSAQAYPLRIFLTTSERWSLPAPAFIVVISLSSARRSSTWRTTIFSG